MHPKNLRVTHVLYLLMLFLLSSTAMANQIEPAAPGSVEYDLTSQNITWVTTSDPITDGTYVLDLLTDRLGQPTGRGAIGIVTSTSWDPDYNEMAATVDFGNNYSAGIVFPELSAVELVSAPDAPSTLLLLLPVLVFLPWLRHRVVPVKD